jgi:hypothetical protein
VGVLGRSALFHDDEAEEEPLTSRSELTDKLSVG